MMKSSSSKKYKSARRHSKLSLMRKKLTLKTRTSPVYCPKECEAANDTEEPNIQPGDDGHDEDNTEHNMDNTIATRNVSQRASPMKLVRLYPHITEAQNLMIRKDDYGGRLDIKCSKLHPTLCKFLVKHFNPWTCKLVFPGRGSIPAIEKSVQEVMGVPMGPVEVIYGKDADAVNS